MDTTLAALFLTVSQTLGLPPGLLSSICMVESHHRVSVVHKHDGNGDSIGVCQIKNSTARLLGFTGSDALLAKPGVNIYYAGKYLKWQLDRYNGSIEKALSAYNGGSHLVGRNGQTKNKHYVDKVLAAWAVTE